MRGVRRLLLHGLLHRLLLHRRRAVLLLHLLHGSLLHRLVLHRRAVLLHRLLVLHGRRAVLHGRRTVLHGRRTVLHRVLHGRHVLRRRVLLRRGWELSDVVTTRRLYKRWLLLRQWCGLMRRKPGKAGILGVLQPAGATCTVLFRQACGWRFRCTMHVLSRTRAERCVQ